MVYINGSVVFSWGAVYDITTPETVQRLVMDNVEGTNIPLLHNYVSTFQVFAALATAMIRAINPVSKTHTALKIEHLGDINRFSDTGKVYYGF